ncbi:MAG: hypothetical protein AAFX10_13420 [Pseudomonadota bacterium]
MASSSGENVDYRLLNRVSNLVICSNCLRNGKVTPVPQIISDLRPPTNLCPSCRDAKTPSAARRRRGQLLAFRR